MYPSFYFHRNPEEREILLALSVVGLSQCDRSQINRSGIAKMVMRFENI